MHRLLLVSVLAALALAPPIAAAQQAPPAGGRQQPPPGTGAQGPPQGAPAAPIRVGGNVPAPIKIRNVAPIYPPEAQRAGVQGVVIIEATIGEDGKVRDAVVRQSIPQLDQAALDAVKQWEFTPTVVDGKPVPVIMTVTVQFSMAPSPGAAFQQPGMVLLNFTRNADGTATVWQIEESRIAALPRWDPEAQPSPLPVPDAIRLAREWVRQRHADVSRFDLQYVTVQRPISATGTPLWYYHLAFSGSRSATPQTGQVFPAIVLCDGSVVEPTTVDPTQLRPAHDAGSARR
jgi:TonB family protein